MSRSLKKSNQQFSRAARQLPLGVASSFRYWGEGKTLYIKQGKGGRITDIDDNSYIDYRLGYGPAILGYAHPEVDAAACEGMAVGGVFAFATEREYTVAKRISEMVPAAEMVRFSNSGTEAVMAALRVARAYTGKDDFIMIEGGYHGVFDAVLWYSEVEEGWTPDSGREPETLPYSTGVPGSARQHVHMVPMNDAEKLEDVLRRHGPAIGSLLIEPMMGNCCSITASVEYMQCVRELCDRYGVLLIIDEVKTGFRVARGGIQELLGVSADLCTFAKAIANGYPISVVAGREELMRQIGNGVVHGGTYTAHSVSLAAAEKHWKSWQRPRRWPISPVMVNDCRLVSARFWTARISPIPLSAIPPWGGCSWPKKRRQIIANGYIPTTLFMRHWRRSCTTGVLSWNRTPANPGLSAPPTMRLACRRPCRLSKNL